MHHALSLAAALLAASYLSAQNCAFAPDAVANSGTCNVIPFGDASGSASWTNQKYQMLVPAAAISSTPYLIRELGFAPCASGVRSFTALKIVMDHYTGGTLTTTFAANLSANAVTVLDVQDYAWLNVQDAWNPIGLQKPFLLIPALGDLVIDIEVYGAKMAVTGGGDGMHRSTTLQRLYAVGWTIAPPPTGATGLAASKIMVCSDLAWATTFGDGCTGTNGKPRLAYSNTPKLGSINFSIDVAQALANAPVFMVYGSTNAAPTYPLDLTPINMPGCKLYTDVAVSFGGVTNGAGAFSQLQVIPPVPTFVGVRIFNQTFVLDSGAPGLGMAATNAGWFSVGS